MKTTNVSLGSDAQVKLINGINTLADAVKSTLGPNGKSVIIQNMFGPPVVTKDGVSVASAIKLHDPIENVGVDLIKQVSQRAAKEAGDGTTTATVLAQFMINEGLKFVSKGVNSNAIKTGMDKALVEYKNILVDHIKQVDDTKELLNIARISTNNDRELGDVIANAVNEVGAQGSVNVESSANEKTYYSLISGMTIERRGWMDPHFVTNEVKQTVEFNGALIYISAKALEAEEDVMPILQMVNSIPEKPPIVFIAPDISGSAFSTILTNHSRGVLKASCIKAPMFGELQDKVLEDLAILTGATINNNSVTRIAPADVTPDMFGGCDEFRSSYEESMIIGGHGNEDKIITKIEALDLELQNAEKDNASLQLIDFIRERMSKLGNGIAQVFVGALTESELKEKKDRVEDALYATKAAMKSGIVVGGGITYLKIKEKLKSFVETVDISDEQIGANLVANSLSRPIYQILVNAIDNEDDINKVLFKIASSEDFDYGYNVYTKEFGSMKTLGVIDPAAVNKVALESAVSIAGLVLTTECVITEYVPEPVK